MKWLRWKWMCWRLGHHVWLAYLDWYDEPSEGNRYRWERLKSVRDQLINAGPKK